MTLYLKFVPLELQLTNSMLDQLLNIINTTTLGRQLGCLSDCCLRSHTPTSCFVPFLRGYGTEYGTRTASLLQLGS